jgi:hypothetical protein
MWEKIKKWWLVFRQRRIMKKMTKNNEFCPPKRKPNKVPWVIMTQDGKIRMHAPTYPEVERTDGAKQCDPWFGVDESLPRICPRCDGNTTPSKIDDRVVACLSCKRMFMTDDAYGDPNIQRDITHANAGVTPRQTKIVPYPHLKGPFSAQDAIDAMRIRREIELDQARAFGEGYTRGKHGMSRAEYNEKKKKERENEENKNE